MSVFQAFYAAEIGWEIYFCDTVGHPIELAGGRPKQSQERRLGLFSLWVLLRKLRQPVFFYLSMDNLFAALH